MPDLPTAFHDIPASKYPVTLRCYTRESGEVWTVTLRSPGVVEIPPLYKMLGERVHKTRIEYGDGTFVEHQEEADV